jgi:hypothetical protein
MCFWFGASVCKHETHEPTLFTLIHSFCLCEGFVSLGEVLTRWMQSVRPCCPYEVCRRPNYIWNLQKYGRNMFLDDLSWKLVLLIVMSMTEKHTSTKRSLLIMGLKDHPQYWEFKKWGQIKNTCNGLTRFKVNNTNGKRRRSDLWLLKIIPY